MIEKILKAVKSENKKRGRNITIGAVVGMLLSCTVVMGAGTDDTIGLEIGKNTSEKIEFKDKNGDIFTPGEEGDPYPDNNWDINTYTNNSTISEEIKITTPSSSAISGSGLKISATEINLVNDGLIKQVITGSSSSNIFSYGINITSALKGDITNNGVIISTSPNISYGINLDLRGVVLNLTGTLTNKGIITAAGSDFSGYGIYLSSLNGNLINDGVITATSGSLGRGSYGIYISGSSKGDITNNGVIIGTSMAMGIGMTIPELKGKLTNNGIVTGIGYGIDFITTPSVAAESLINTGVIYGKYCVISISEGTLKNLSNYGLLVTGGDKVIDESGTITAQDNYGLAFKVVSTGKYSAKDEAGDSDFAKFGTTDEKDGYTVINGKAEGADKDNITGTDSLTLEGGTLSYKDSNGNDQTQSISLDKKYVLNGITDTLVVSTGNNKLDNSVVNAYTTAIKFDDKGGNLTLSGTIVNGGADGSSKVILGGNKADTLTLQNGTIINGTIDGGTGDDTLNFGETGITKAKAASSNNEIRIQHDISNFENINVNSNVTFYETGVAVTGVNNLTIGKNGVLTLRINRASSNSHALSGNTGTISSKEGGKLLLALNGAGLSTKISFGSLNLDASLKTADEEEYQEDVTFETTSALHSVKRTSNTNEVEVEAKKNLPSRPSGSDEQSYKQLNKIYHSIISVEDLIENFNVEKDDNGKSMSLFLAYLNDIYAGNPYSYSSELSRKSAGMFRDIVTENIFRPETNKWMIYGGLTHVDGGTKDTYYGKGYYTYDVGSSDMDADTKITGAYMLGEYGVSDTLTSGVVIGGNKLKSDLSNGSKVDGSAMYLGAYAKKYVGNLKVTAGAGFQYGDYDADRLAVNRVASDSAESVMKYSDNYNDITYDIYLNGRYSHNIGDNLFLEPYATLSYTYVDQDGANEGNKTLAIETDSKSFDYTVGKVGVDLKKVIPHEKGKSTLSAGVSYTKILDGADEEHITGRFKGGSDFDILVAHKNEHSIGLNAKYALELENGVILDVKGSYSVERDSHNGSGKNKTKGEWIVGAGLGYKF